MTLPLIFTLEEAPQEKATQLKKLLTDSQEHRQGNINLATAIIEEAGGFDYTRKGAETLVTAAKESLEVFPDCQAKQTLIAIADYVLSRDK